MRILTIVLSLVLAASTAFAGKSQRAKTYPIEFQRAFQRASDAFDRRDFDASQTALDEAEKIVSDYAQLWNLKGAIAIERGNYDEGLRCLKRALELNPLEYVTRFNLTELAFRQKKYAESRKAMERLLEENPKDELVQYKIYLSYLFEKNDEKAKEALDAIKFPSNTPAYYYAHTAWELAHQNAKEAEAWMKSAAFVFTARENELFAASLREVGWLPERPASSL